MIKFERIKYNKTKKEVTFVFYNGEYIVINKDKNEIRTHNNPIIGEEYTEDLSFWLELNTFFVKFLSVWVNKSVEETLKWLQINANCHIHTGIR